MTDLEKTLVFMTCVLSTSPSLAYHVGGASLALEDALHDHLVTLFRHATNKLYYAIEELGCEVYLDYYVDGLEGRDYVISVSTPRGSDDPFAALIEEFHQQVRSGLEDIPAVMDRLEEETKGKA